MALIKPFSLAPAPPAGCGGVGLIAVMIVTAIGTAAATWAGWL
jgi:hypothetical protein